MPEVLADDLRVGWCPGALRPMAAGDGLLVRIKPRGNRLTIAQALGVAAAARRFGNGVLNLTGRANLQMRGVSEASLPAVVDALSALHLLDPDAAGEAARNVVSSPLAGSGFAAAFDIRPAVAVLEDALVHDAIFDRLPAKFAWTIDDGGCLGFDEVATDVRFTAIAARDRPANDLGRAALLAAWETVPEGLDEGMAAGRRGRTASNHGMSDADSGHKASPPLIPASRTFSPAGRRGEPAETGAASTVSEADRGRPCFRIGLSGGGPAAICKADDLVDAAHAVARAFFLLCARYGLAPHRMRDLVAVCGAAAVFAEAGLPLDDAAAPVRPRLTAIGPLHHGAATAVGVAPPFGRLEAERLAAFAEAAARAGATDLRMTPWRSMIAADVSKAAGLLAAADLLGFIVDAADPRLAVVACAGAPACRRAGAPVQDHAARLAPLLGRHPIGSSQPALHLSGCTKGCAQAGPAALTAVARDGLYDLVRGGGAADRPDEAGLSLDALAAMLAADADAPRETA